MRNVYVAIRHSYVIALLGVPLLAARAEAAPGARQAAQARPTVRTVRFDGVPDQINPANLYRDPVNLDEEPVTLDPPAQAKSQPVPQAPKKLHVVNGNPDVLCPNGTNSCASCCDRACRSQRQREVYIQRQPMQRTRYVAYASGCAGGACAAGACGAAAFGSRGGRGPVRGLIRRRPRLLGRMFGRRCR